MNNNRNTISLRSSLGRCIPFGLKLFLRFLQRVFLIIFQKDKLEIYDEGGNYNKTLQTVVNKIINESKKDGSDNIRKLKNDILLCYIIYGFTPLDYYLFNFHKENNSWKCRKGFISDVYKDYKLFWKEGTDSYAELYDKYRFYKKTGEYFKRDVMFVNSRTSLTDFVTFAISTQNLFIKSNSDSYGRGTFCAEITNANDAKKLYDKLSSGSYILEERLRQCSDLAKWNESSINTIRLNTYLTDRGFNILAPFLRTGRKGSIVDNGGAGGIFATINENNGEIYTNGYDEMGNCYTVHPDSGIPYKGEYIPEWKALLTLAEEIHRKCMPNHIYIGWDFAYTDKGWTLIEGNWGQFICQQITTKRGFKNEFDSYMSGKSIFNK